MVDVCLKPCKLSVCHIGATDWLSSHMALFLLVCFDEDDDDDDDEILFSQDTSFNIVC